MANDVRFVTVKGKTYLLKEDVAEIIREVAGGEETDVRNRLEELAYNLFLISKENK